ncbi:hypothetical protein SAMN02745857_03585 [Andreprevotia lacus DSM 23236]|jgi:hypothetical protein|uniref:Uncharacterized protein n=2 Tax=Andreprevotia TaxID=397275 RepID=A0A1W1XYU1_9NEIS|nr:hypothetical protein SAMN02745857_03585 [Andreprevotia lacus DSM 23236]
MHIRVQKAITAIYLLTFLSAGCMALLPAWLSVPTLLLLLLNLWLVRRGWLRLEYKPARGKAAPVALALLMLLLWIANTGNIANYPLLHRAAVLPLLSLLCGVLATCYLLPALRNEWPGSRLRRGANLTATALLLGLAFLSVLAWLNTGFAGAPTNARIAQVISVEPGIWGRWQEVTLQQDTQTSATLALAKYPSVHTGELLCLQRQHGLLGLDWDAVAPVAACNPHWAAEHSAAVAFKQAMQEESRLATRIIISEHIGPDDLPEQPIKRPDYASVPLTPVQRTQWQALIDAMPTTPPDAVAGCFNPHHRIDFYRGNTLHSSIDVCLSCVGVDWGNSPGSPPTGFFDAVAQMLPQLGLHPERNWQALAEQTFKR